MGVTLQKTGVTSVTLPFPAHSQPVEPRPNQSVNYTPSGSVYTVTHGPTKYRITRTFEGLTDAEEAALMVFWQAIEKAAGVLNYQYTDKSTNVAKSVPCRIIEAPKPNKIHKNNWDVSVVFEQATNPNAVTDPAA